MLKVAMLSKWHVHAGDYARQVRESGKAEITAVWDDDAARGAQWAASLGAEFEPELDKLLARGDVDAVVCDAPTTMHPEILIPAARAGKHIFTEKALAASLADAKKTAEEIDRAGVNFVISMPQKFLPDVLYAQKLMKDGAFGRVTMICLRNAHSGVSNGWLPKYWFDPAAVGGGAMMDLGCHPMYLLAELCGKPKRVSAVFNELYGTGLDENSICTIEFENGVIGVSETGFLSYNSPSTFEIYGTEGTLIRLGGETKVASKSISGVVDGFVTPSLRAYAGKPSPLAVFIDACTGGAPVPSCLGTGAALALSELLECAYISDRENRTVIL